MSNDNELLDRLTNDTPAENGDGEHISESDIEMATPIPVRVEEVLPADTSKTRAAAEEALRRAAEEERMGRNIVEEYEDMYYHDESRSQKRKQAEEFAYDPDYREDYTSYRGKMRNQFKKINWSPRSYPVDGLSSDEKLWAAIANGSFLLTIAVAMLTDGMLSLLMVFVPLAIYFNFRDKSEFVAFQALQAFAAQLVGTLGWVLMLTFGWVILGILIAISGVASFLLIGIPFVILFSLLGVVFTFAMLGVPIVIALLSGIGAWNTYNGSDYRYPVISQWIDRQGSGGITTL